MADKAKYAATIKQHGRVVARTAKQPSEKAAVEHAEAVAKNSGAESGYADLLVWRNGMLINEETIVM